MLRANFKSGFSHNCTDGIRFLIRFLFCHIVSPIIVHSGAGNSEQNSSFMQPLTLSSSKVVEDVQQCNQKSINWKTRKPRIFSISFPSRFIDLHPCAIDSLSLMGAQGKICCSPEYPYHCRQDSPPQRFCTPSQVGNSKGSCGWLMKRVLIAADCRTHA